MPNRLMPTGHDERGGCGPQLAFPDHPLCSCLELRSGAQGRINSSPCLRVAHELLQQTDRSPSACHVESFYREGRAQYRSLGTTERGGGWGRKGQAELAPQGERAAGVKKGGQGHPRGSGVCKARSCSRSCERSPGPGARRRGEVTLEWQMHQHLEVLDGAGRRSDGVPWPASLHQKQKGSSCRVGVSLLCEIQLAKIWGSPGNIRGSRLPGKPHSSL